MHVRQEGSTPAHLAFNHLHAVKNADMDYISKMEVVHFQSSAIRLTSGDGESSVSLWGAP